MSIEQLGLRTNVISDDVSIANGVVIHTCMTHLNEQTNTACQECVVRMMVVVSLTALDKTSSLTKVMRKARLNRHNHCFLITRIKQRLNKLHHLARLNKLTCNKAPHHALVHLRTHEVVVLLVTNQFAIV